MTPKTYFSQHISRSADSLSTGGSNTRTNHPQREHTRGRDARHARSAPASPHVPPATSGTRTPALVNLFVAAAYTHPVLAARHVSQCPRTPLYPAVSAKASYNYSALPPCSYRQSIPARYIYLCITARSNDLPEERQYHLCCDAYTPAIPRQDS